MKRIIMILVTVFSMCCLIACGSETKDDTATGSSNEAVVNNVPEDSSTTEPTKEPGSEVAEEVPTEETVAEPTPQPTEEPELSSDIDMESDLPGAEWINNLYNALLQDDYVTVTELLENASNVRENCADYEYTAWSAYDDETAYKLTAADGTIWGIVVYEYGDSWTISAFISDREGSNHGFSDIGKGDHFVEMSYSQNGTSYNYIKDGITVIYSDGSTFSLEGTTIGETTYIIWHD